jgi:uncharacterized protein (DUF1778 family)
VSDWRERIVEQVEATTSKRKRLSISVNVDAEQHRLIQEACRRRGISMTGFMRRAAMSFTAHDLELVWDEIMADEQGVKPFAEIGDPAQFRGNVPLASGKGFGEWQIGELHG